MENFEIALGKVKIVIIICQKNVCISDIKLTKSYHKLLSQNNFYTLLQYGKAIQFEVDMRNIFVFTLVILFVGACGSEQISEKGF